MEIVFRILVLLICIFDKFVHPLFWIVSTFKKAKKIPKIKNSVLFLSATELAAKIRKKEVSSEYVVSTYIERIKEVNPYVNAVVEDRFEDALREAKAVDSYLQQNRLTEEQLERLKPFFGVPITIKESTGLKGLSQEVGHFKRVGLKATDDGEAVKRLKLAGCIPLLVSTIPELCIGLETINLLTGITKNPYNTNMTSGGSSGGEGALIGSASSVIGIGSDLAGSIRIPAMFNGIFGHKPTSRIIPRQGHIPASTDEMAAYYFTLGPLTRYAIDLKPMLKIMSGKEGLILKLDEKVNLSELNVFYCKDEIFGIESVQNEIHQGILKAANYLKNNFNSKSKLIHLPELNNACEMGTSLFFNLKDLPNVLEDQNNPKNNLSLNCEIIKSIFNKSNISFMLLMFLSMHKNNGFIPTSRFPYYLKKMQDLKRKFLDLLGDNGVFFYPTFPTSAFQHYHIISRPFGMTYSMIFNLLGCPSTQVPIGLDYTNMPIGMQVIAAPNQDRLCLAVAEELEKCFGGWVPPS